MYIYFSLFYIALSILIILYSTLNDVCCNTTNKLPEILSKILPNIILILPKNPSKLAFGRIIWKESGSPLLLLELLL